MALILLKDLDTAWIKKDFGSGEERYKVQYYSPEMSLVYIGKLGHIARSRWFQKMFPRMFIKRSQRLEFEEFDKMLLDWEEIKLPNGELAPCSRKNKKFFCRTSYRRKAWIIKEAQKQSNFGIDTEELVGNLPRPSNTNSNGAASKQNSPTVESA